MKKLAVLSAVSAILFVATVANAVQFDYLAPGFSQQIYGQITPTGAPGMVWSGGGNLLTKDGSNILEYSLTQNTTYQGTSLHGVVVTHPIPGLYSGSGTGLTKGLDGFIYVPTGVGLQRFSASLAGPAVTLLGTAPGPGYGITTLPDGRIAYVGGGGSNQVYVYDPGAATNTPIYTAPSLIDDIEASATGAVALALQQINAITIISNTGAVINTLSGLPHHPDGLAFGDGVSANWLYSNNNDGSITQYKLGPGYSGIPVIADIAKQTIPPNTVSPTPPTVGGYAYGDLAAVGPDCAFYVSQFSHPNGLNGSTIGAGTHWDNGVTTVDASIIRIAAIDPITKQEYCGFGSSTHDAPEPGSMVLLAAGGLAVFGFLSVRKRFR